MPGNSNYPAVLDTDTQLYRVSGSDPLIPAHHNNMVDAIESLEAAMGTIDDGSGSGLTPGFTGGLAHFVGMPSTQFPNRKYPWFPVDTRSIYGNDDASLAQWTLGSGVIADWTTCPGILRLDYVQGANQLLASCTLPAEPLMWAAFRIHGDGATDQGIGLGFSIAGDGTDLDGWASYLQTAGPLTGRKIENNVRAGSGNTLTSTMFSSQIFMRWNGTNHDLFGPYYGMPFRVPAWTWASRGTPTKFCITTLAAGPTQCTLWIEYLAFGWADPVQFFS